MNETAQPPLAKEGWKWPNGSVTATAPTRITLTIYLGAPK